ncbi:MAG TPA: MBL fold metallo-hydrolase [Candidatus Woesebacteria bacterium]|nr:MBL fold metallo-hydrolase [Candidatus Woesebacteria bacterium]HPJ17183.1 MBL fold metallo-hydrolase [Candidatus Woesebacteria bacterium]
MEIRLFNKQQILIKGKKSAVVVDGDDYGKIAKIGGKAWLLTEDGWNKWVKQSETVLINGPGEYEVGGIEIMGTKIGDDRTGYVVGMDGLTVFACKQLDEELSEKKIEKIGGVDIMIVGIDGELAAKKVLDLAKKMGANYLIPTSKEAESSSKMKAFLDEADCENQEWLESIKIEGELPEGMEVVCLKISA